MDNFPAVFPIGFIGTWFGVLFLIARIGGWQRLSEKYGVDDSYTGPWKAWQWGMIGRAAYKHCLWIAVDFRGLHMKVGPRFLFGAFHRPLLIPWTAIRRVEQSKYWWMTVQTIKLNDSDINLMLEQKALEGANQFLGDKVVLLDGKAGESLSLADAIRQKRDESKGEPRSWGE